LWTLKWEIVEFHYLRNLLDTKCLKRNSSNVKGLKDKFFYFYS
jgi:hypothetical protein